METNIDLIYTWKHRNRNEIMHNEKYTQDDLQKDTRRKG